MKTVEKFTEDYNRIMFGGDYELVKVKDPATDAKGHGAEDIFMFIRELSGETIKQTGKPQKKLRSKIKAPIKPGSDSDSRVKAGGYMRRKEAAKYLGISLRTLTDWQQRRVIPFVDVSDRVTLFKLDDLDKALNRFVVKAVGEKP